MLAAIMTAIAAQEMSAFTTQADKRDPPPRSGTRIASMNSASSVSDQATNKRPSESLTSKPAKPSIPNTAAAAASAAIAISDRANRNIRHSLPSRERSHSQKQRQKRGAEEEAHVGKVDRAHRKGTNMTCKH